MEGHLAAAGATKYAVNEGGLQDLPGRLGVDARQDCLMHGIQQRHQILVRVLLPPQPEAARQAEQASETGAAAGLLQSPCGTDDSAVRARRTPRPSPEHWGSFLARPNEETKDSSGIVLTEVYKMRLGVSV